MCILFVREAPARHNKCVIFQPNLWFISYRYIYKETYIICLSFEIDRSYVKHYLKRLCSLFFLQKHMAGRGAAAIYPSHHAHYTTGGDATDLCKCCFLWAFCWRINSIFMFLIFVHICLGRHCKTKMLRFATRTFDQ